MRSRSFFSTLVALMLLLCCLSAQAAAETLQPPYILPLPAGTEIYAAPSGGQTPSGRIDRDGSFTIVEERPDSAGALWGRLKSGAGWVRLSDGRESPPYDIALGASVELFYGPGRDYGFCALVDADGIYTVTEEAMDSEGNVWARLDGRADCWLNLTALNSPGPYLPLSVSFADRQLLDNGGYWLYMASDNQYTLRIAFRANEELSRLRLAEMIPGSHESLGTLASLDSLSPGAPFVAGVEFPGDLSTFGMFFDDSQGVSHLYLMTISGRDGSLVVTDLSDKLYVG